MAERPTPGTMQKYVALFFGSFSFLLLCFIDLFLLNPFTATGYSDIPPPRWPTFLVTLFPILKEGMGLSLLEEFEVQYHVIKKCPAPSLLVFPARSDAARRNFYRPVDHDWHVLDVSTHSERSPGHSLRRGIVGTNVRASLRVKHCESAVRRNSKQERCVRTLVK